MPSLSHLARQAEQHARFVAAPLAAYQRTHDLSDQQLAEQLRYTVEALTHLKLRLLPCCDHFQEGTSP